LRGIVPIAPVDAPQRGSDAGHELGHLERLAHVVVGTRLETYHDVDGVGACREHHDRNGRAAADGAGHLEAVHPRQHDVEQHQVGVRGLEPVEPGTAVVRGLDRETGVTQPDRGHFPDRRVVLDEQDPGVHRGSMP
jgi:hypothetical protein